MLGGLAHLILLLAGLGGGPVQPGYGNTPSLTPLTPAQQEEQITAVQAYDNNDWATALPLFTQLAALGDARAETDLGMMYENGWGVTQDSDKGFALQMQAVAQHYGKAEDHLGDMYRDRGDQISATHWLWLSAQHGDANGEDDLGWQFYRGYGVPEDDALAAHWFSLSAAQGNPGGEYALGVTYENGTGVPQDYAHAMRLQEAAAAQGETSSMCALGTMYRDGEGTTRDYGTAMDWYKQAAGDGDDCGDTGAGFLYDLGLGVPRSETIALQWYKVAANDGDAMGENDVGAMYHRGAGGVPQDFVQAAYWFGLAADQGNATAEMNLATLYINGQGVNHNDVRGFTLDQMAAAQNEPHAEEQLGNAYRLGYATRIDYNQAATFYARAAGHGLPQSQQALAYLYETGQGVPRDDATAYKWYLISQAVTVHPIIENDERCQEFAALPVLNLADIQAHLTTAEAVQAQMAANAWLAAHQPLHGSADRHVSRWVFYAGFILVLFLISVLLLISLVRRHVIGRHSGGTPPGADEPRQ